MPADGGHLAGASRSRSHPVALHPVIVELVRAWRAEDANADKDLLLVDHGRVIAARLGHRSSRMTLV